MTILLCKWNLVKWTGNEWIDLMLLWGSMLPLIERGILLSLWRGLLIWCLILWRRLLMWCLMSLCLRISGPAEKIDYEFEDICPHGPSGYRRKAAVRNYWTRLPWGLTVFSDLAVQIKKDYKFYYSSLLRFYKVLLPPFTTFMYYYVYTVPICYHRNSNYLSCIPYLAFTISMFTYACCFIPLHVYPDWQSLSTWRCLQVQAKLVHAEATASIFDMVYFDSIPDLW